MKNLEGEYNSTYAFVEVNDLQGDAEKLFGKEWEAEDDVHQIEELIEEVTKKSRHYTVIVLEHKDEDDIVVKYSEDKARIELLEEQNKALIERLNASHKAIDNAVDTLDELFDNQFQEDNFYIEMVSELAPNEELLRSIESK